ncbi:hypothetical protein [Phenylobacterium sp.]|uniref:hypothetical protein n=1 Tax=Phenylobacterium sp. TaxID=1871053 RepID=UPI002BFF3421|nr:hypothetical protein [Phenylobacterium sp.]HVI32792.1 hypothetical protein [Phenylobacterium sp.]
MRQITGALLVLTALGLAAPAAAGETKTPRKAETAQAAQHFAQAASYRGPVMSHGYSARARRIADCLATYPGYNPKTDRVVVRPGVTRRCELQVAEARR